MSKALSDLITRALDNIPVAKLGKTASEKAKGRSFSENLKKTIHILIINDYFIKTLAPRAVDILKSLPGAGSNGNIAAAIISEYRGLRGNARARVKRVDLAGNQRGYALTFPSYDAVRSFLTKLGLSGSSKELMNYIKENPGIRSKLEKLLGNSYSFSTENEVLSGISRLNPSRNTKSTDEFFNNQEAFALYRELYEQDLGFDIGRDVPVAYKQVEILASNPNLLAGVVKEIVARLGLSRKLTTAGIDAIVADVQAKASSTAATIALESSLIVKQRSFSKTTGKASIAVFIESSNTRRSEKTDHTILNNFRDLVMQEVRSAFTSSSKVDLNGVLGTTAGLGKDLADATVDAIMEREFKTRPDASSKSSVKAAVAGGKVVASSKQQTHTVKLPALRDTKGRFTSLSGLEAVLRRLLYLSVVKNMQRPNLRMKTGRLAASVELKGLVRTRGDELTAFVTYMKYPYETFERGFKQGFRGYYPSRLLDESVRDVMRPLVSTRLHTVVV